METNRALYALTETLYGHWKALVGEYGALDDADKTLREALWHTLRKLEYLKLSQNRRLLTVTGNQGAGKTSLMKWFYGLDNYLPDNIGRGETVPILITESDLDKPRGYVREFDSHRAKWVNHELSAESFRERAITGTGWDVWMELRVPARYFGPQGDEWAISLALLPGYEWNDQTISLDDMLDTLLSLSISSIVVFRPDTFARDTSERMAQSLQAAYGALRPLFVVSRGDTNPDLNEKIRVAIMEKFDVEDDRCIGTGDPLLFGDDWRDRLRDAIVKHSVVTSSRYALQVHTYKALCDEISSMGRAVVRSVRVMEEAHAQPKDEKQGKTETARRAYWEKSELLLDALRERLPRVLNGRKASADTAMTDWIKSEYNLTKNLLDHFRPHSLEDRKQLTQAIYRAWESAAELPSELQIRLTAQQIVADTLIAPWKLGRDGDTPGEWLTLLEAVNELQPEGTSKSAPDLWLEPLRSNTHFNHLVTYFTDFDDTKAGLDIDDVRMLLYLCVSLVTAPLNMEVLTELSKYDPMGRVVDVATKSTDDIKRLVSALSEAFGALGISSEIVDGQLHTFLTAVGLQAGVQSVFFPAAVIFACVFAIHAAAQLTQATDRVQMTVKAAAGHIIDELPKLQADSFVEGLKAIIDFVGQRLDFIQEKRLGVWDELAGFSNVQYRAREIRRVRALIMEALVVDVI